MSGELNLDTLDANQTGKEIQVNSIAGQLEAAIAGVLYVDVSNGNVVATAVQLQRLGVIDVTGTSVARTLTLDPVKRLFAVTNRGTAVVNVAIGTTTVAVAANSTSLLRADGAANGLFSVAGGGASSSSTGGGSTTPGPMPTLVQSKGFCGGDGPFNLPVAPANGNLLLAFVFYWNATAVVASGWTAILNSTSAQTSDKVAILYKIVGNNESVAQIPMTGVGGASYIFHEIAGAAPPNAQIASEVHDHAGSTLELDIVTTAANALIVGAFDTVNFSGGSVGISGTHMSGQATGNTPGYGEGRSTDGFYVSQASVGQVAANAVYSSNITIAAGVITLYGPSTASGSGGGGVGPAGPQGPKGDTGATGAAGAAGAKGDTGATGAKGDPGVAGPAGSAGQTGAAGPKGDTGIAGPTGATGAAGSQGATGPAGSDGAPGSPGAKGDKGDTGSQGVAGNTGATGAKGDTGAQGLQGIQGVKGDTGTAGTKGDTGAAGTQGPAGTTGATGAKGDTGTAGAVGSTGATGSAGASFLEGSGAPAAGLGNNGDSYLNTGNGDVYLKSAGSWAKTGNLTGPQGAQGTQGAQGATGATGSQGTQGTQGPAGATGSTGAAGTAGTAGTNGTNGTNGSNYLQGNGAPASATGSNGDSYGDNQTGDVYLKSAGAWAKTGNARGLPTGTDIEGSIRAMDAAKGNSIVQGLGTLYDGFADKLGINVISSTKFYQDPTDKQINNYGVIETTQSVPAMTGSNTPASSTITSSSDLDTTTYQNWRAFDQVANPPWASNGSPPAWVQRTFTTAITVAAYRIVARTDAATAGPNNWILYGSNDGGTTLVQLDAQNKQPVTRGTTVYYRIDPGLVGSYTTYRLTTNSGQACYGDIQLLQVIGGTLNLDVRSTPQALLAQPSKAYLCFKFRLISGTQVMGTDFLVSISSNGGTNFQTVTMVNKGVAGDGFTVYEATDIPMTANLGTSGVWRFGGGLNGTYIVKGVVAKFSP